MANGSKESEGIPISVYCESQDLLNEIDEYAEKEQRKRSNFIMKCVRDAIAQKKKEEQEAQ